MDFFGLFKKNWGNMPKEATNAAPTFSAMMEDI